MKEPKNPSRAFLWLLLIPLQLVIDIALISLGAYLDTAMVDPEAMGHPAPILMFFFGIIAAVFTVLMPVIAIIIAIVKHHRYKKAYKEYNAMG